MEVLGIWEGSGSDPILDPFWTPKYPILGVFTLFWTLSDPKLPHLGPSGTPCIPPKGDYWDQYPIWRVWDLGPLRRGLQKDPKLDPFWGLDPKSTHFGPLEPPKYPILDPFRTPFGGVGGPRTPYGISVGWPKGLSLYPIPHMEGLGIWRSSLGAQMGPQIAHFGPLFGVPTPLRTPKSTHLDPISDPSRPLIGTSELSGTSME